MTLGIAIYEEGIFRISGKRKMKIWSNTLLGSQDQIFKLKERIDNGETIDFFSEKTDCHVVAGLLRLYVRQLPEVILSRPITTHTLLSQYLPLNFTKILSVNMKTELIPTSLKLSVLF